MEKTINYNGNAFIVELRIIEMQSTTAEKHRYTAKIYIREIDSVKKDAQRTTPVNTSFYATIGGIFYGYPSCRDYAINILDNINSDKIGEIFGKLDCNKIARNYTYNITDIFNEIILYPMWDTDIIGKDK